jgi:hypothetical protein
MGSGDLDAATGPLRGQLEAGEELDGDDVRLVDRSHIADHRADLAGQQHRLEALTPRAYLGPIDRRTDHPDRRWRIVGRVHIR